MKVTTDDVAQMTFLGPDDKKFAQSRRSQGRIRREVRRARERTEMPDEPCCGHCLNWHPPSNAGGFGECRAAGVALERGWLGTTKIEKGTILVAKELGRASFPWEPLATRVFFGACRFYRSPDEEKEAA